MGVFDQILAAAQQVYPFTGLSLSLAILFAVIILGVLIAAVRGFFERRRARLEAEADYDAQSGCYQEPSAPVERRPWLPATEPESVVAEVAAEPVEATKPVEADPLLAVEPEPEAGPEPVVELAPVVELDAATEPEAAAVELAAAEAAEPVAREIETPATTPLPADEGPDDLTAMRGVGPRLAERLNTLGITRFVQIAMLDADEAAELDAKLGANKGQLTRDRWVDQAQMLALGDIAGFEKQFAAV